jgi:hypothetical protein
MPLKMVKRVCENCIYWLARDKGGTAGRKLGDCYYHPVGLSHDEPTCYSNAFCGKGKFKATRRWVRAEEINPAGSSRLYNLEGETVGWYHWIVEDK